MIDSDNNTRDESDVRVLLEILWRKKIYIIFFTIVGAIISVYYAINLPNIYSSTATLIPSEEADPAIKQNTNMLGLVGLVTNKSTNVNKIDLALNMIKSRKFINNFIDKYDLNKDLLAVGKWDSISRKHSYNTNIYNSEKMVWYALNDNISNTKALEYRIKDLFNLDYKIPSSDLKVDKNPSKLTSYKRFISSLFSEITDDGIIILGFKHQNPDLAKEIVTNLVMEINLEIREMTILESKKSRKFLEDQVKKISYADLKNIFFVLIQSEIKKEMLAEVKNEYVFKTIDPAFSPEIKSSPNRKLICITGTFSIFFVVTLIFLISGTFFNPKKAQR